MNARAELKPVEIGKDRVSIHRIARAMDHVLTCRGAIPNYPANQHIIEHYDSQYQELCGEMLGALHG
jgi:hypothetical protein